MAFYRMNQVQMVLPIPTEAIPALIGYQGQKHKDLEKASDTKIKLIKNSGPNC